MMNCDTGDLRILEEGEKLTAREILVEMEELTKKQKKEMKVSLHDTKSVAGKKRIQFIRYNDLTKNQRRNLRRKLK